MIRPTIIKRPGSPTVAARRAVARFGTATASPAAAAGESSVSPGDVLDVNGVPIIVPPVLASPLGAFAPEAKLSESFPDRQATDAAIPPAIAAVLAAASPVPAAPAAQASDVDPRFLVNGEFTLDGMDVVIAQPRGVKVIITVNNKRLSKMNVAEKKVYNKIQNGRSKASVQTGTIVRRGESLTDFDLLTPTDIPLDIEGSYVTIAAKYQGHITINDKTLKDLNVVERSLYDRIILARGQLRLAASITGSVGVFTQGIAVDEMTEEQYLDYVMRAWVRYNARLAKERGLDLSDLPLEFAGEGGPTLGTFPPEVDAMKAFLAIVNGRNPERMEMSFAEFMAEKQLECFLCGELGGPGKRNGVDQVVAGGGYSLPNGISCCKGCNFAKGDMPLAEYLVLQKRISEANE